MRPGSIMRNVIIGPLLEEHVQPGFEVLDRGGYDGSLTAGLSARGARVTVVDLDEKGLQVARDKGLNAVVAPAEQIPFPDRSFDMVVCCDLLPSVPRDSEEKIFREIGRVLKPGGILILTVPDAGLSLPFVNMKDAYESWQSREGISRERLEYLTEIADVQVMRSREYFGLPSRLYYALAFYLNVPRMGTRVKRRLWRYVVAGENLWCPAPQAHLIVARPRKTA
jgi:ubiquinone/menaquinone biosynthesis C-methylase UbiE